MANTITKLGSYVVPASGTANNITFSSLSQAYQDLYILVSVRGTAGTYDTLGLYFNGSQANISNLMVLSTGTAINQSTSTYRAFGSMASGGTTAATNSFTTYKIHISNYSSTTTSKHILADSALEAATTTASTSLVSELWTNTAAITSIMFDSATQGQNFAQYSSFTVYGIKNS